MSSLAPHSARGEPATPARTMRSRMQRRSSLLQSVGPGAKFASASPVKPRVLFPHRGRSSLGGTSASTGTPVRLGKTGATLRRSRGRGSGLVTNAQPPPLETLDDCDEQSWWDELDDDIVPNMDLVNRLVNSLREQRKIHNHGRETAKQIVLAKERAFQSEVQELERLAQLQLEEKDRRHQEALDVVEDEFTNQERILAATQRDNERLMIEIGLFQSSVDDLAYVLAETYGQETWQSIVEKAVTESKTPGEPIRRSLHAQASSMIEALPGPTLSSNIFPLHQSGDDHLQLSGASDADTVGAGAPALSSDPDADESEVSMLLQPEVSSSAQRKPECTPGSQSEEERSWQQLDALYLPQSKPKPRSSALSAVTAPVPFSPEQVDASFNTAGDLENTSAAASEADVVEAAVPEAEDSTANVALETPLKSIRLALLGMQRELALEAFSRQEYLNQADEKIYTLQRLIFAANDPAVNRP